MREVDGNVREHLHDRSHIARLSDPLVFGNPDQGSYRLIIRSRSLLPESLDGLGIRSGIELFDKHFIGLQHLGGCDCETGEGKGGKIIEVFPGRNFGERGNEAVFIRKLVTVDGTRCIILIHDFKSAPVVFADLLRSRNDRGKEIIAPGNVVQLRTIGDVVRIGQMLEPVDREWHRAGEVVDAQDRILQVAVLVAAGKEVGRFEEIRVRFFVPSFQHFGKDGFLQQVSFVFICHDLCLGIQIEEVEVLAEKRLEEGVERGNLRASHERELAL